MVAPWLQDRDVTIYQGDALDVLRQLPAESVHCCVTSPPFFGLRDYGVDGQIGLEATPEEWCSRLVDVFREVRRVLRADATLWLEVGDAFANKQLLGAPWKLAFELQARGWYLRSEIIWWKRNAMPESVRDRPTQSHSRIFLLSKSARYFFDSDAVRIPHSPDGRIVTQVVGGDLSEQHRNGERWPGSGRNIRTVWDIPTQALPFEHYAAFPEALVEPCILAGTSERGCCPECGAPWMRMVKTENMPDRPGRGVVQYTDRLARAHGADRRGKLNTRFETTGWEPSCSCRVGGGGATDALACAGPGDQASPLTIPATVLDPFLGSGTTALVARRLGRHTIGIELSNEYCEIAARRLKDPAALNRAALASDTPAQLALEAS